jgi:transcriptional regulator with XRE-family HTH domain
MTYGQLLEHGCRYLESKGVPTQQIKNLASALRLWIQTHGYSAERIISEEFGVEFDASFLRYSDAIAERLAPRTQRDRQEQMLRWRRIAELLRKRDVLPADFSAALRLTLSASPLAIRKVARDSGIPVHNLKRWAKGERQPAAASIKDVARLETVLELPVGTLVTRLPLARRTRYSRNGVPKDQTTSFTKLRRAQLVRVRNYAVKLTPRLARQWQDLLRLKTDPMRDQARARNTWRLKPIERVRDGLHNARSAAH